MSATRLEAFSDGVIAIAITLLVLNITVPELKHGVAKVTFPSIPKLPSELGAPN